MVYQITVKLELEKDAWNYRSAFNKNTHSSKWKEQINSISDFDFNILLWISEKEAYLVMKDYLENFRKDKNDLVKEKIENIQESFEKIKDQLFFEMEKLTKNQIYRQDFTIFLTSLNRWPYNVNLWYTWNHIFRKNFITPFIHELLHFQTIVYYKQYIIDKLNDERKFEDIKEALTFLLNYEFKDIIDWIDNWYPQHQGFRKKLEEYRINSQDKDFVKLVDYACDII